MPSPDGASPGASSELNEHQKLERFRYALLKQTPAAVLTVLIVLGNVGVYVAMLVQGVPALFPDPATMIDWGANYAPRTLDGELWRLFTCMFLHFGAVHLGMNMLALWNLGRFVERLFGNAGFLLLYLISGLAGSLASVIWNPSVVSAGASGAIFGVAGGLLGGVWKIRRSMPKVFLKSAWWLAVNVLVLLAIFTVINSVHSMIDNAAHVAGFVAGGVIGWILAEPIPNPKPSRKRLKLAFVAVAGTAGLWLTTTTFAQPPVDVVKLEVKYHRVEDQTLEVWQTANERLEARAITPEEYAAIIETEILPAWKDLHQTFREAENVPEPHQDLIADLLKIIELRAAGWERKVESIRENDPQKDRESLELLEKASDIIEKLNEEAQAS